VAEEMEAEMEAALAGTSLVTADQH
jgi:hypothetical protein